MDFVAILGLIAGRLPVLLAGIILLAVRRNSLPRRAMPLGTAGLIVLGVTLVVNVARSIWLPSLYSDLDMSFSDFGTVLTLVGLVQAVFEAIGIGLLIAAILARPSVPAQDFGGFGAPVGYPYAPQPTASPYEAQPATGSTPL